MLFYRYLIEIGTVLVDLFQKCNREGPQRPSLITALRMKEPELWGNKTIVNKAPVVIAQN